MGRSDAELLEASRRGERDAFAALTEAAALQRLSRGRQYLADGVTDLLTVADDRGRLIVVDLLRAALRRDLRIS